MIECVICKLQNLIRYRRIHFGESEVDSLESNPLQVFVCIPIRVIKIRCAKTYECINV